MSEDEVDPTHWQQMDRLSPHWKALLLFLQTIENGDDALD